MISDTEFGLASPGDAPVIALISRDEIEHGLRWAWTATRVRRAMRDPNVNVVVAREAAQVVAFALMRYDDAYAHLLLLGVSPARRRRGLATALMKWLEATMCVAGIAAVQVELRASNTIALAFYEKLGFEPVHATRRYYQGLETALHLVKEIGAGIAGPSPPDKPR